MSEEPISTSEKYRRIKIDDNLFKRGEKYYYRKGTTEKVLGKFKTDAQAREYRDAFEAKRNSVGLRAFNFRAKHIWPDYLEQRRRQVDGEIEGRKKDSPRTFAEIDSVWRVHLRKYFGNRKLADIDDPLWEQYCTRAVVADLTNHRKVLKTFLRWSMKRGYIRALPILDVPQVQRRKRRILSVPEIEGVLKHAHGKILPFVALYMLMGLRWTEIRLLTWATIDFPKATLTILDETTRTRRGRVVPINSFVLHLLEVLRQEQAADGIESPYVFPKRGSPGKPMIDTAMRRPWERLLARAGITGITPHDMRATFEYYAARRSDFTDSQREKMAGASMKTQNSRYLVSTDADFVKGLEESVQFEGLSKLVETHIESSALPTVYGKRLGKTEKDGEEK